jgi:hypothetical protein
MDLGSIQDWEYKAEGNQHVVISHSSKKVLLGLHFVSKTFQKA